jgi:transcriptional regulator GlxA family with amidase domain
VAVRTLGVVVFPGFELLDVYGPLEVFGGLRDHVTPIVTAARPGPVASAQGPEGVAAVALADCPRCDLLLVPGGIGTRTLVDDAALTGWLARRAAEAEVTMSVCTGAALLARAGVLDGRRATTNKRAFRWVVSQGPRVEWVPVARWVDAGAVVTSSGVSAGIDMCLAVVARLLGSEVAEEAARRMEYRWERDPGADPFAAVYGLRP